MKDSIEVKFHSQPVEVLAWRQFDGNIDIAISVKEAPTQEIDCYDVKANGEPCEIRTISAHDKVPFLPDMVPTPTSHGPVVVLEVSTYASE